MSQHEPPARHEELANTVSHGVALVSAVIALPALLARAIPQGLSTTIGTATFGVTVIVLYGSSTLYHAARDVRRKDILRQVDHSAIYLLIAGTYTPFTLGVLRGAWGWTLFGLIWTMATAGVVLKSVWGIRHPRLSTALYLGMGWMILIAAKPLWDLVPPPGVLWLVAGGLAYTVGVAFYANPRIPYGHFIWHLFVIVGTACHYVAVWKYSG